MSFASTVLLGALAGLTIFLGLPLGRMRLLSTRARVCLAMFAVGILAFIFFDVMAHASDIVNGALADVKSHHGTLARLVGLTALLITGFGVGCAGLSTVERRLRPKAAAPPIAGGAATAAMLPSEAERVAAEADRIALEADLARRRALQTGMVIASAIGLHNFAEGLAIGVSARAGAVSLATVLIIGFALHNATEGFGIVGPLGNVVPSWRWIGVAGLVGGGPTFLGAVVGYQVTSSALELLFLSLAAGAILFVIGEIWHGMRRHGHRELGLLMLTAGLAAGVITDLVVSYGGG